ncbi:hypothetical protein GF325_12825 [Candidatus Bathyarchaeota archaeon]|nr:hypothetical protein [Candidatus Bathyarchaeota archaeon]
MSSMESRESAKHILKSLENYWCRELIHFMHVERMEKGEEKGYTQAFTWNACPSHAIIAVLFVTLDSGEGIPLQPLVA